MAELPPATAAGPLSLALGRLNEGGPLRACVQRYLHSPEPAEDLMQVGYAGLVAAINNFDPSAGCALAAGLVPPGYAAPAQVVSRTRRIILRSGAIAVRNLPSVPDSRARPLGTSEGIAGTVPSGEDGPVAVEVVYGIGGTLPGCGVVG